MSAPNDPAQPKPRAVVLGVCGSGEADRAGGLARELAQDGVELHVLMSEAAAKFIRPAAFAAVSRHPVLVGAHGADRLAALEALATRADLYAIAPATANTLAKLAHGLAEDAVSAFALLHDGPMILAPAVVAGAWASAATQANVRRLQERGAVFIGPGTGAAEEPARMAPAEHILDAIRAQLVALDLPSGGRPLKVLITAGPTREAIDPVRFISNRSSGKMGTAIAAVAAAAGHDVTLISGPTSLPTPPLVRRLDVTTAAEMAEAVRSEFPRCHALVMAAAVADYRPSRAAAQKIKKGKGAMALELERTEDILASVAGLKQPHQHTMGFAAETENIAAAARDKLERKRLDWIVANDVSRSDIAFGSDANEVTVFTADGEEPLPRMSKLDLAARLLAILLAKTAPSA